MPIYEYACGKCGAHVEVMQKVSDPPLKRHGGGCGGKLEKQLSRTSFQLKGSGWYVNYYAGKKLDKAVEAKEGFAEGAAEETKEAKNEPVEAMS